MLLDIFIQVVFRNLIQQHLSDFWLTSYVTLDPTCIVSQRAFWQEWNKSRTSYAVDERNLMWKHHLIIMRCYLIAIGSLFFFQHIVLLLPEQRLEAVFPILFKNLLIIIMHSLSWCRSLSTVFFTCSCGILNHFNISWSSQSGPYLKESLLSRVEKLENGVRLRGLLCFKVYSLPFFFHRLYRTLSVSQYAVQEEHLVPWVRSS